MQEAADVPRRASLRQRGVKSSGMAVDYDLNGRFRVQYENGVRPEGPHLEEPQPEAPKERHPGGQHLHGSAAAGRETELVPIHAEPGSCFVVATREV